MPDVFVGAGTNADPVRALRGAVAALEERLGAVRCSSVYSSAALGVPGADYLDMVIGLRTSLSVAELRELLRALESAAGRERTDPAVCALDLDLLLYGARVDAAERLPRPKLFELPFVVGPLAELAPDLVHPVTGERAAAAWRRCAAQTLVPMGPLGALA